MKRGLTLSGQAGMHEPLPEQTAAHRSATAEPISPAMRAFTAEVTAPLSLPASPAGAVIGHTSKQVPHAVQRSSTSCVRDSRALAKAAWVIGATLSVASE